MEESNNAEEQVDGTTLEGGNIKKSKPVSFKPSKFKKQVNEKQEDENVLLNVWKFKYKLPGKRQRLIVGSIVLGLNLLLVILVAIYFYNPAFQDFIYNVGRDIG